MPDEIIVIFPAKAQPVEVNFERQEIVVEFAGSAPADISQVISMIAATDIGGHRVITSNGDGRAIYADKDSVAVCVGITTGAAGEGTAATVQISGELSDPSFVWEPGELIFLGSSGIMTQSPPDSGALVVIGQATAANKVLINIQPPITLS